jgi:hypothetical protein
MQCGRCGTDNVLGATFCRQCGQKIELSDAQAHAQALASVRQDNWEKAFLAMSRTLYFFFLVFVGALLFRSCALQEIVSDHSAAAPTPLAPGVDLRPAALGQAKLPMPTVAAAGVIKAEQNDAAAIVAGKAQMVRDRLRCSVMLRSTGIIRGWLLSRTKDEIRVITQWEPYTVRTMKVKDIHFPRSKLP